MSESLMTQTTKKGDEMDKLEHREWTKRHQKRVIYLVQVNNYPDTHKIGIRSVGDRRSNHQKFLFKQLSARPIWIAECTTGGAGALQKLLLAAFGRPLDTDHYLSSYRVAKQMRLLSDDERSRIVEIMKLCDRP